MLSEPTATALSKQEERGDNAQIIATATDSKGKPLGFDYTVVQPDWALLRGRSGLFQFTKTTGGTSIVYPAGAREGDFAMKIVETGGSRSR